jgi:hypothetical protein
MCENNKKSKIIKSKSWEPFLMTLEPIVGQRGTILEHPHSHIVKACGLCQFMDDHHLGYI